MSDNLAIFIMVHGRPDKMWTAKALRRGGYTGKIYYVADDLDSTLNQYRAKYGDDLLVFNKAEAAKACDAGDNSGDLRSTLFAANTIPGLAASKGYEYFFIMCDDYNIFRYPMTDKWVFGGYWPVKNLDRIFDILIEFYKATKPSTIALAQTGDFIGGGESSNARNPGLKRKAMNTFLCRTDNPIRFVGRLNEDVTAYTYYGSTGGLFFTVPFIVIVQPLTQEQEGGLSGVYRDCGTYVKSFFSVMYNPSCVTVNSMGMYNRRLHHHVNWRNAVPKILSETNKR